VATVGHKYSRSLARPLLDLLDHRRHAAYVAAHVGHVDTDDGARAAHGRPATAYCTLYPGRKPPSPIFITRASASVVDARADGSDCERCDCSSVTVAIAASTRS